MSHRNYEPQINEESDDEGAAVGGSTSRSNDAAASVPVAVDVTRETQVDTDPSIPERTYKPVLLLDNKWPKRIGILQLVVGFVTLLFGVFQILVIPLLEDTSGMYVIRIAKYNFFGMGLWTGILLAITGSTGLRAAMTCRPSSIYRFFILTMLTLLFYMIAVLIVIIGYSSGWTTKHAYYPNSTLYPITICVSVSIGCGMVVCIVAFTQYYEDVFFGQLQLLRKCVHCVVPCWCPRVGTIEEMEEEIGPDRPPSLPV